MPSLPLGFRVNLVGMAPYTPTVRWVFAWLQHRNMEAMAEVAWTIAGAYLSFYITQVCE